MQNCLVLFAVINFFCIAKSQLLVEENGSGEESTPTTTVIETTTRRRVDRTDIFMPIPTNLKLEAVTTESVTLSYEPPQDYLTDVRYTHFRVEFSRTGRRNILTKEILKTSEPSILILNLQPGALYEFAIRSQGRDLSNNFRVSPLSETIKVRTNPPNVVNFKVQQVISNKESVIISWDGLATSLTGPMYNKFVLKYFDTNGPENTTTIVIPHQSSVLLTKAPTNITHIAENLSLGATYNFTAYTESSGEGEITESDVVFKVYRLRIPGPLNLVKQDFTDTSILVGFDENSFVSNIKAHFLSYVEVNSGNNLTQVNLPKDELQYNITSLKPGAIYLIKVHHLIDSNGNENSTESATVYARTKPTPPKNVVINSLGTTSIEVGIEVELDQLYNNLFLQYEFVEKQLVSNEIRYAPRTTSITVNNLVPGGLYSITLTYESSVVLDFDATNASTIIEARTIPFPPANFVASSRQGKIILNWDKPLGIDRPISWSYEIQYTPVNDGDQKSLKISLWNRDGASKMFHSLDDITPGTSYEIAIYTIAGESGSEFQSRSASSKTLTAFSQPQNPRLDDWVQVSLKLVRLIFNAPSKEASNFDYFFLNVTRIRSTEMAVEYYPESYSHKLSKNESSKLLELTPGGVYRVVLTTVVGSDETWLQSVVNSTNSKVYEMWSPYDSHSAFSRLVWRFSACGQIGREGPDQIVCNNAYKSTNLNRLVMVEKGIQHWIVPMDGLYRIIGAGAGYKGQGGLGASVSGIYHLKEGSQLKIAVGQQGFAKIMAHGGAGGTFVIADDNNEENEPLLVAGGAGSCKNGLLSNNITNGRLNHSGADASLSGPRFGKGGQGELAEPGLKGSLNTAGGAGYRGVSESFVYLGDVSAPATGYLPYGLEGQNFNDTDDRQFQRLLGGFYTATDGSFSQGGFGGGGNGYIDASGGGGGYSGGGGGPINGYSGGGGSYIKFTGGMQYAEVENNGPGFVKIVLVGLPVSSPVPLTLYLLVAFFVGIVLTLGCGMMLCWVDKCIGRKYNPKKGPEYINLNVQASVHVQNISGPQIITQIEPENINKYETSVPEVTSSPPTSGLYVQDIDQANFKADLDSESSTSDSSDGETSNSSNVNEYNLSNDNYSSAPLSKWEPNVDLASPDEDSKSESTASSVSSIDPDLNLSEMGTELETSAVDTEPVTSQAEETSIYSDTPTSSSATDDTSSESGSENESTLPPTPPPPPKAEELLSEEQKAAFREKLKMFQLQSSSGAMV